MRVQVREKWLWGVGWGHGSLDQGGGIRRASAAVSSRTELVEFGPVLQFAASRMSFLSIVSSLGHGGSPLPPSSSSWRPFKASCRASLVTGADEPSIARRMPGASRPPRPSSLMLGAGFAVHGINLLCMGWIYHAQTGFDVQTGTWEQLFSFLARFCSSRSWMHPTWALPTSPPLLGMDFGGAGLPFQPISPPLPQESLGEGPRRSIRTPRTMASSELPPHPAVGTVSPLELGFFWGGTGTGTPSFGQKVGGPSPRGILHIPIGASWGCENAKAVGSCSF